MTNSSPSINSKNEKLIQANFSSTNAVYLPEDYDELAKVQKKQDKVTLWKNDQGNSSIVLLTNKKDISATLSSSDFVDKNDHVLSSRNVEANFQKYVSTYTGSNWIPTDPRPFDLPPIPEGHRQDFPDIIYGPKMEIDKESVQPIWVKITIPKNTEAGVYEGTISIEIDNRETIYLNQTIEVLDIVLEEKKDTDEDDYYLNLWQYPYSSADYYDLEVFSEEHLHIVKNQMKPYLKAGGRVGTASIVEEPWYHQTYADYPSMVKWEMVNGKLEFDYTDFDIWADFLLKDAKVSYIETYSIAPWENRVVYMEKGVEKVVKPKPASQEWDDLWRPFMESFVHHLEEKGWFDKIIIAMDERPYDEMNAALDLIESVTNIEGETLKVGGAFDSYDESTWDRLFNVTPHLGQLVSGGIDKENFKKIANKRRKEGKKTTIYTMIADYPGMFTMSDPSESAWTIWFTESFNADGFLRWAYDAWVEKPLEDTSHPYFESGDMFQVYPGDYAGKETQVRTSPRFERLTESINDIRKLRQLSRVNEKYASKADEIINSVKNFYGQATANGIGTAGFRTPDESTRVAIADEMNRLENEVILLSKEYLSEKDTENRS